MKACAFSPAHITGFFALEQGESIENTGSIGAGISLSLGSYAILKKSSKMIIDESYAVTKYAVTKFGNFETKINNELPPSNGFGVSASSTLAAAIAAAWLAGESVKNAVRAAHEAEVKHGTGLGDVIASVEGGMEARLSGGINGRVKRWRIREKILLAVVGEEILTSDVIEDAHVMKRINEAGRKYLKMFIKSPSFDNFMKASLKFTMESGIADERMIRILKKANEIGHASMCMIGNSIFAGYSKKMEEFLTKHGEVYSSYVNNTGTRLICSMHKH